jgi:uncharacterized protein (TIGR03067 family)
MRVLAVLVTLFVATALGAQDATKEMERLNGVWVATSGESGGTKLPAEEIKDMRLTISDGTYTIRGGSEEQRGTVKVDPTKRPMTMDITLETGPNKGKTQLAIYDVQVGVLRVCGGEVDKKERPTSFDTKNKPGVTLVTFKKAP